MSNTANTDPRCKDCWFFNLTGMSKSEGTCRRYPPVLVHIETTKWQFPILSAGEWCGEWKARGN